MSGMEKKSYYLPAVMWERLKAAADEKGISVSELIRRILDLWLENKK